MRRKIIAALVMLSSGTLGVASDLTFGHAERPAACGPSVLTREVSAAAGSKLVAARASSLVAIDGSGSTAAAVGTGSIEQARGVIRNVATRPGRGTAYVDDLRGPDDVVIQTSSATVRLPQTQEASNPVISHDGRVAWSTGAALHVWSSNAPALTIAAPRGASSVFAPVFLGRRFVAVASQTAPSTGTPEGAVLDNLFRYDPASHRWMRLTRYRAGGDDWSIIRTPVAMGRGVVEFIRVVGHGDATADPRYELWRLKKDTITKIRSLDREMFLAGELGGSRVWNVFDRAAGDWRLFKEGAGGHLIDLGCGRILVDPRAETDPDRAFVPESTIPANSAFTAEQRREEPAAASGSMGVAAILVGDYALRADAQTVLNNIVSAYGVGSGVGIIDSTTEPSAVKPGVFAVVMPIGADVDPEASLSAFRAKLPQYANVSWLVTL